MSTERNPTPDIESNPIGEQLLIEVSIPQKVEIKMVDASSLGDYELWVFIASLFCNFTVGFLVATITNTNDEISTLYWAITIIFGVLFVLSGLLACYKRQKIAQKKKTVSLGVSKISARD